ncbi:hypothetical protein BGZ49_006979 [Haplosporangium sp. Z 27]|nr:hypothetical protein BGZ49_006979 [Haplosporangium sp. Z 27]
MSAETISLTDVLVSCNGIEQLETISRDEDNSTDHEEDEEDEERADNEEPELEDEDYSDLSALRDRNRVDD